MTSEQRERLLGQIAMGASLKTACATLGVTYLDLIMEADSDRVFRMALSTSQDLRDMVTVLTDPDAVANLLASMRDLRDEEDMPDL